MHDSSVEPSIRAKHQTLQLTMALIPILKERGYQFVRLDAVPQIEALAASVPTSVPLLAGRDLALATYRTARARFPDDAELLFQEALLLCEAGDLAEAERCLVQFMSVEAGPSFAGVDAGLRGHRAHYQLGLVYHQQGRADLAEEQWLATARDRTDFIPAWLGLGELYLVQGRWPELEGVVQQLAANPQGQTHAAVLRARKNVALKEFTAARQLLEEAIARSPDAVWPREVLSYALLQEGRDWVAAEQALRAVLAMAPEHPEARHNLGLLLQQQAGACGG
jgi:tetratricopeptide (TPR) repeat protein